MIRDPSRGHERELAEPASACVRSLATAEVARLTGFAHGVSTAALRLRPCLAALVAVQFLTGCLQPTTSVERAATFQSFAARRVGAERLQDFIAQRTALLIGGMPADEVCSHAFASFAGAVKAVHGRYALGSATAIDSRGYLLTAAHCVAWKPLQALYWENGHVRLVPARVVWSGDADREGRDLALLAIDRPLPAHFAWAGDVRAGEPVVGAGPEYDSPAAFGLGWFSGTAVKTEARPPAGAEPAGTTIYHTGPVHLGDSGGPLATLDGRLVGITVGDIHELNLLRFSYQRASRAHRPDLAWLRDRVERDFASRRQAPPAAD